MLIKFNPFMVHQFTVEEQEAFALVNAALLNVQVAYSEGDVLGSPNTGEVVCVNELARVRGVLSFIAENRVVEVNP